mmetsp:Transcript_14300/g.36517  ORF Transcript_14300/g.36517 Transcript_14300/m.36517 type:complete len:206 (-) Transcript_14300:290-907(-)
MTRFQHGSNDDCIRYMIRVDSAMLHDGQVFRGELPLSTSLEGRESGIVCNDIWSNMASFLVGGLKNGQGSKSIPVMEARAQGSINCYYVGLYRTALASHGFQQHPRLVILLTLNKGLHNKVVGHCRRLQLFLSDFQNHSGGSPPIPEASKRCNRRIIHLDFRHEIARPSHVLKQSLDAAHVLALPQGRQHCRVGRTIRAGHFGLT